MADLPPGFGAGSNLLEVSVTGGVSRSDEFDLSITDDRIIEDQLAALTQQVRTQQAQITELPALLAGVTRGVDTATGVDTVVLSGANFQVASGTGVTNDLVNGAGNVIIGYNESSSSTKTGSHNLVIGSFHSYTRTSVIVAGYSSSISGAYATVVGGNNAIASGAYSSIV